MNRTVLIGSILIVVAMVIGTILIAMKEINPKKIPPAQVIQDKKKGQSTADINPAPVRIQTPQKNEKETTPALAAIQDDDINAQKNQDTGKMGRPSAPASSSEDNKKDNPDIMSMVKEKMKDPAMREQMLKQVRIQLAHMYAPLYNDLGFDDEKREKFTDTIMDFDTKSMDLTYGDSDGASKKEEASKLKSELDENLKDLLGADFPKYEEFKDSIQPRYTIDTFNQTLMPEEKLESETQKNLVKALTEELKLYGSANKIDESLTEFSTETLDALEKRMADLNKKYIERAGFYLNEKQLKSFKDTLDQQLAGFKLGRTFTEKKK